VDWDALPASVDPARGGRLGTKAVCARGQRKRWQVESIFTILHPLVEEALVSLCLFHFRRYAI
jgi:hypothetical protein